MRHANKLRRLNRNAAERKALLRGLVTALLRRQRITTTLAKAKEARRVAEWIITLGKRGEVANQRKIFSILLDRSLVKEIVTEIAPRFKTRQGGYTRIIRLAGRRKGDNAESVILELTEQKVIAPPTKKAKKEKKQAQEPVQPKEAPEPKPKEEKKPPKEEHPKHLTKEERKPHGEKPQKKGFFQGLTKFLRPPKTTS